MLNQIPRLRTLSRQRRAAPQFVEEVLQKHDVTVGARWRGVLHGPDDEYAAAG